jgi:hypothetical protein
VAGEATHAGRAHAAPAALYRRLVHAHGIALPRRIVSRMAVEAARMHDHFACFLEERHGALFRVGDAIEARYGRKTRRLRVDGTGQQNRK